MFREIEIWILYLVLLLTLPITILFGGLVRQELVGEKKLGKFSESALFIAEIPRNIRRLFLKVQFSDQSLEDRFPDLDGFNGTPNSYESYLLLSRFDGDIGKGIVELVDLKSFKILHTWSPDIDAFNSLIKQVDEFKYINRDYNSSRTANIHPKLNKNGQLIFQSSTPLRFIDACSNLIFQNTHDQFHHSIETDIDENLWVSTFMNPATLPVEKIGKAMKVDGGYADDGIVNLSPDGKQILFEKSVSQIFIDNGLEYLLFARQKFSNDPIHINDIQPVNFDSDYWKKGDVFLSLRNQSMVLLYRPKTNQIIWKGTGPFFHQHDVDILDDHRISVFNNRAIQVSGGENIVDGHSEVNIYNFKTNKYSSYLKDSLLKDDVKTVFAGRSEILPNGDLMVEETFSGRTLFYNSDGSLRWTHLNRADNGNVYGIAWSRILYTKDDILNVNNFLNSNITCKN